MRRLGRILLAALAIIALVLVAVAYLGAGRQRSKLRPAIDKLTRTIGNARRSQVEIADREHERQTTIDKQAVADRIARRRAEGTHAARLRVDREARRHEAARILRGGAE